MTAETTNQRQIVPSLLLVLALALIGLHAESSAAKSRRSEGTVVQQAVPQAIALRMLETKPGARKVQQPFALHLVCPGALFLVCVPRFHSLRRADRQETAGGIARFGDRYGRAPPRVSQA